MKRVKNLKTYLLIIFAIFILYIIWGGKIDVNNCSYVYSSQPLPVVQQIPNSTSTRFKLEREYRDLFLHTIMLEEATIFAFGSINDNANLLSLDTTTGQINWQTCASGAMNVGTDFVFVSYTDTRGAYVVAYDKESKTEVWQEKVDFWRHVTDLTVTPFGLLVQTANRNSERYYLLNMETGKQEASFRTKADRQSFWINNGSTVYRIPSFNEVIAQGKAEWQTKINYDSYPGIDPIELILNDDVIVAYKKSPTITQIAVLDQANGAILWQTDLNIQSNLVVEKGVLFFVTGDTELMAFDLYKGVFLGSATFSPGVDQIAGLNTRILVSASGNQVVVYFSSSYQLFVFHFT
ncbi:MAG: PQQ-binding-like beta-propeller repeat protein [Chloroflexi bacterium]|nr:PQQ-binding-like beta-propeller repeat protein [Chloroflexota bacterium]